MRSVRIKVLKETNKYIHVLIYVDMGFWHWKKILIKLPKRKLKEI